MAEEGKKISFGFSKSIKKPLLKNVPLPEQKKIDYIECLNDKSIKIVGGEEKKDGPLVIPMLGSKTWHDRIINKVDADIFEPKTTETDNNNKNSNGSSTNIEIKQEPSDGTPNGNVSKQNTVQPMEVTEIKTEPGKEEKPLSLEEQAAREIMADLNSDENKDKKIFTVPVKIENEDDLRGKEESTLEDYENIPIEAFGEAMLRGMGWQPGKGIGKDEKVVAPVMPELRPKGMGLGADKLTIQRALQKCNNQEGKQTLKLVKGGYVKVTEGKYSGNYGTVEVLNDDDARVFVKLALGGTVININEYSVQPVSATEFTEKSKVLNLKSYEEYKQKEAKKEKEEKAKKNKVKKQSSHSSNSSDDEDHKNKREKSKKSKKNRHQSPCDESSPERTSRRKRNSSSGSDDEQKYKKSKKSKKHKSRDSSSERSSRKNRKKDKEREKSRHKKSDYADSSERVRHRDRKRCRSRSRSHSPNSRRRNRSRSRSPRR